MSGNEVSITCFFRRNKNYVLRTPLFQSSPPRVRKAHFSSDILQDRMDAS